MRALFFFGLALSLAAQTVPFPDPPPFDPADPEGFVEYPNKTGRYAWKRKGTWTPSPLQPAAAAPAQPPAAVQSMKAVLDALSSLLRATPEGASPTGWFMKEPRRYHPYYPNELPPGVTSQQLPIVFSSGFYPFYLADDLRNGAYVQVKGGETQGIYFEFNRLPGQVNQPVIAREDPPGAAPVLFFTRPSTQVTFRGYPVLDGADLLITRAGRDPYTPVPYGRALRAALAEYEKDRVSAEQRLVSLKRKEAEALSPAYEQAMRDHFEKQSGSFRESNPQKYNLRLKSMERELVYNREKARRDANPQRDEAGNWYWSPIDAAADAQRRAGALTPAESAEPACFLPAPREQGRYAMRGHVLPASSAGSGCLPLVTQNFQYFDPKLPRTAPQLLLIPQFGRCFRLNGQELVPHPLPIRSLVPPQGCFRHVPMWQALDWSKIAALLAPS